MPELPVTPAAPATPAASATPAPVEGSKTGAPAAEETKTYTVNGKEYKIPLSKIDERVQKSFGAEEAMKNAANMEKAFNNFVAQATDPTQLLQLLQHPSLKYDEAKQEVLVTKLLSSKSPRVVTAVKKWLYENEIAPSLMDPKEREIAEAKARLAEFERKDKERTEKEQTTAKQIAVQKKWQEHRANIGAAIKAEGLPETEGAVARIARYALLQVKAGKPVDIADAAKRVKADYEKESEARFGGMTEDNVLDHIPAGLAEMINKAFLKRLKGSAAAADKAPAKKDESGMSLRDSLRAIERGHKVFE